MTGGFEQNCAPYECRAFYYLTFLSKVLEAYDIADCSFVFDTKDCAHDCSEAPLFTFQRDGSNNVLLPDVDFLGSAFYANRDFWGIPDFQPFIEKQTSAIFTGSTTGAGTITRDALSGGRVPRVEAARFFKEHNGVAFLLPSITQASKEAEADMRAEGFGSGRVTWAEQLRNKFLISIDGNGATCSRVYVSLVSNCVLLKYASRHEMFYFDALLPGHHYLEIVKHQDVIDIVDRERRDPGVFLSVANEGRLFAETILSREALEFYTATLLQIYASRQARSSSSNVTRNKGEMKMFRSEGVDYTQFIAAIASKRESRKYLEIGVHTGRNMSSMVVDDAVGVDPTFVLNQDVTQGKRSVSLFRMSSDRFFKEVAISNFDLVFLDGMHLFEYLLRDFYNAERNSIPNALILIHDCLPYEASMLPRHEVPGGWTGDVWKIVPLLQKYRQDLKITLIDCSPTGLIAVSRLDPKSTLLIENYQEIVTEFGGVPNTKEELEKFYMENEIFSSVSILSNFDHSLYFAV